MKRKLFVVIALLAVLSLLMTSCKPTGKKGPITVGSKEFTEQLILGQMAILALEDAGFEVNDKTGLGGTKVCRDALTAGEIDLYWEYTGTALLVHLGHEETITDPQECYEVVKKEDEANNLVWLDMAKFNNTYTLMMRKDDADAKGIKTISDLAAYVNAHPGEVSLGTDHEFYARPDGFKGVEELYGFQFPEDKVITMDWGLGYKALKEGQVVVAMGFATDGRIEAFGLVNLVDDKAFFPVYNPAPVVRKEVLDKWPEVADVLNKIGPKLDTATMTHLNYLVDVEEKDVEEVARTFLEEQGIIKKK